MSRISLFNSPLFLGFDQIEQTLDRIAKTADGFPPYDVEQTAENALRITLAIAGFSEKDLQVQLEANQLTIRGRKSDDKERVYLHRGIAGRQFQRSFVLADGMEVTGASLENGLLHVDLERPINHAAIRTIEISTHDNAGKQLDEKQVIDNKR